MKLKSIVLAELRTLVYIYFSDIRGICIFPEHSNAQFQSHTKPIHTTKMTRHLLKVTKIAKELFFPRKCIVRKMLTSVNSFVSFAATVVRFVEETLAAATSQSSSFVYPQ